MGVLSLIHHGFALAWQPVPSPLPHRELLADISGAILFGGALAMLVPRLALWSSVVLSVFVSSWLLLQISFRILPSPLGVQVWTPFAETVMLVSGGWILTASQSSEKFRARFPNITGRSGRRSLQLLYAFAPPVISLSHFVFSKGTADMIPAWMPFRLGFAYFTGVAHIAAGIGILTGVAARLAATLEATMLGVFVVVVHMPLVAANPSSRLLWTMLFAATACSGASWIVASSFTKPSTGNPARKREREHTSRFPSVNFLVGIFFLLDVHSHGRPSIHGCSSTPRVITNNPFPPCHGRRP